MTRQSLRLGLAAALGLAALLAAAPKRADAATLSFTAQVYSFQGRVLNVGSYSLDGIPPGLGFEHEALQVDYNTSGLPYYVSNVTFAASAVTKFVATADGIPQPATVPSLRSLGAPLGSSTPAAPATLSGPGFGNSVSQNFGVVAGFPEFTQGASNAELTYVRIDNSTGEMKGHGGGFTNDILAFNGSNVIVTFTKFAGAPAGLPNTIVLANAFAIATPANTNDPNYHNYGTTGQSSRELNAVPEPGTLLTLIGLSVSASAFFLRRRRA